MLDALAGWCKPEFPQGEDHPIVCVNWEEARRFCQWLSVKEGQEYRLPTDCEWDAAVGARKYPWGNQWPPRDGSGNYADMAFMKTTLPEVAIAPARDLDDGASRTAPVGSYAPNRRGLYDLGGNVAEWCEDCYRASMDLEAKRPELVGEEGGTTNRVVRGDSWFGRGSPSAIREGVAALERSVATGFRCVVAAGQVFPPEEALGEDSHYYPPAKGSIGSATMEHDGTIVLRLRAASDDGDTIGDGLLTYAPDHRDYKEVLRHLGGLEPGESKPVAPWPDAEGGPTNVAPTAGGARSPRGSHMASTGRVASASVSAPPAGRSGVWENSMAMKFCWCPPGEFLMGSPAGEVGRCTDELQHRVRLTKGFWLGKYEVTQDEYARVMGMNPSAFARISDPPAPVEQVTWEDAVRFCRRFTELERRNGRLPSGWEYRLPTEAQWEYACRAGATNALNNGTELTSAKGSCANLDRVGWFAENSESETHSLGQKGENAWGLHDMHGNVWEWCSDWYGSYPSGFVIDPVGPASGLDHVFRGGGWFSYAQGCRAAERSRGASGYFLDSLGFRVAAVPSIGGE